MPDLVDFDAEETGAFTLRAYQQRWKEKTLKDRTVGYSRLLLDAVGGSGKTTYAGAIALHDWGTIEGRMLILENRRQLVVQTAKRIRDETGLDVDIEMDDQRASPFAQVVIASAQSIGRIPRLTSFPDNHFSVVVADEAHNSTARLFLRIMQYFHYGAESLAEDWVKPKDGEYSPKATVIGITATPDSYGKRNLGNFYQKFTDRYSYLQAIEDGWLVAPVEKNIPVRLDTRAFRRKASGYGMDFSAEDESNAIIPIIDSLADQIVLLASNRKTMCYLPSKECAIKMSESLNRKGLKAVYVLGDCLDRDEKTDEFEAHGPGICLCLCAMYVEGTDFPTVDTVAWMRPTLSPAFYKQGVFRMTRVLPGVVNDSMTAEERRAAIAASEKPFGMIIAPFYPSDDIDMMRPIDLFVDPCLRGMIKKSPADLTNPEKIRDFIKALQKAADKHAHKQARTIDPLKFALDIGDNALANYQPLNVADAAPPTQDELDFLLEVGIDTTQVKCSGHAQRLIDRYRERDRNGYATPKQLSFLRKLTKRDETGQIVPLYSEDWIVTVRKNQAGALMGRQFAKWER